MQFDVVWNFSSPGGLTRSYRTCGWSQRLARLDSTVDWGAWGRSDRRSYCCSDLDAQQM